MLFQRSPWLKIANWIRQETTIFCECLFFLLDSTASPATESQYKSFYSMFLGLIFSKTCKNNSVRMPNVILDNF